MIQTELGYRTNVTSVAEPPAGSSSTSNASTGLEMTVIEDSVEAIR